MTAPSGDSPGRRGSAIASFVAFAALAIAAQAALLQFVDSPHYAVFQHLRIWEGWCEHPLASALVLLLLVVCVAGAVRWVPVLGRGLLAQLGPARSLILIAIVGFSSAVAAVDLPATILEAVTGATLALMLLGAVTLAVRAIPESTLVSAGRWLDARISLPGGDDRSIKPWDRRLPWAAAAWVLSLGALIGVFVFERMPHIDDSISYLFQAKYYATGRLYLPAPPDSAAFHVAQVVVNGDRWFSYGFPGWPAVLAAGVRLGVPWLVNPVLAALSVPLAHAVLRRTYDRGTANLAAILLATSPWLLFMAGELFGHPAANVWLLLTILGILMQRENPRRHGAAIAGVAMGLLFLTRPFDALVAGVVLAPWALGWLGVPRLPARSLVIGAVVAAAVASLSFAYNRALTGDPLTAAHNLWSDRAWGPGRDRLGFGRDVGIPAWPNLDPIPGHGVLDVALNLNKNLFQVNTDLFGWGIGSLFLILLFLLAGKWQRSDRYLIALAVASPVCYSAYWFSGGPDHGARYWFGALVPFVALTARGVQLIALGKSPSAVRRSAVWIAVGLACVGSIVTFLPWRMRVKYFRYRDVTPEIGRIAAQPQMQGALVFIHSPRRSDFQSAFVLNAPDLSSGETIFANYLDAGSRARVAQAFADRPVWVITRDSLENERLSVSGPFAAGQAPP